MPERCTGKDHIFEIIENPFKWGVFIRVDLIDDNALLFVNLFLRKNGVKDDVGNQFGSFGHIPLKCSCVNDGLFFGRIGIQLSSEVFQPTVDVICFAVGRSLEKGVLKQMGQTVL